MVHLRCTAWGSAQHLCARPVSTCHPQTDYALAPLRVRSLERVLASYRPDDAHPTRAALSRVRAVPLAA